MRRSTTARASRPNAEPLESRLALSSSVPTLAETVTTLAVAIRPAGGSGVSARGTLVVTMNVRTGLSTSVVDLTVSGLAPGYPESVTSFEAGFPPGSAPTAHPLPPIAAPRRHGPVHYRVKASVDLSLDNELVLGGAVVGGRFDPSATAASGPIVERSFGGIDTRGRPVPSGEVGPLLGIT